MHDFALLHHERDDARGLFGLHRLLHGRVNGSELGRIECQSLAESENDEIGKRTKHGGRYQRCARVESCK